jgi:D-alanyl-D-alanine dipeptidase
MIEDGAPARRRRLGAHGMMFRRRRIFARLREVAAEAVAAGDVTAITPYLKVLDRFDRYRPISASTRSWQRRRART